MKNIFLILFILISSVIFSQNYKVVYDINFQKDSTNNKIFNEQMSLFFNRNESIYLSDKFVAFDNFMNDEEKLKSILSSGKINPAEIREKYPESLITHSIFNSDNGFIIYSKLDKKIYKILQPKDKLNWELVNESKEVNGVFLKKASLTAFGRKWIAWYREDIPIQFGPYKFEGLPGLITELYDINNYFTFNIISLEKIVDFPNVIAFNKSELIDLDGFKKLYNNRVNLKIERFKNLSIVNTNISQQEIEKRIENRVKSENLHLEKDLNLTF